MPHVSFLTHFMGDENSDTKSHKLLYLDSINKNNLQIKDTILLHFSRLQNRKIEGKK